MTMIWEKYRPLQALHLARTALGIHYRSARGTQFKGHEIWRIDYLAEFELAPLIEGLRRELDQLGWLFVTMTRKPIEVDGEPLLYFGVAPILRRRVQVAYHATRASSMPLIRDQGLLPSNPARSATDFPDTEGLIHVCKKLRHKGNENDSALWWMHTLRQKNRFNDPDWGVLRIDMTRLPADARVYQDLHSASGIIVDRIERIDPELITIVKQGRLESPANSAKSA